MQIEGIDLLYAVHELGLCSCRGGDVVIVILAIAGWGLIAWFMLSWLKAATNKKEPECNSTVLDSENAIQGNSSESRMDTGVEGDAKEN